MGCPGFLRNGHALAMNQETFSERENTRKVWSPLGYFNVENPGVLLLEKTALAVNHAGAWSAETAGGEDGQRAEAASSRSAPAQGCSSPSSQREELGSQATTLFTLSLSTYSVRSQRLKCRRLHGSCDRNSYRLDEFRCP